MLGRRLARFGARFEAAVINGFIYPIAVRLRQCGVDVFDTGSMRWWNAYRLADGRRVDLAPSESGVAEELADLVVTRDADNPKLYGVTFSDDPSSMHRAASKWRRSSRSASHRGRLQSPAMATIPPSKCPGRASSPQTGPRQACFPSICPLKTAPTGLWASPPFLWIDS
jgi:hypothetical protein